MQRDRRTPGLLGDAASVQIGLMVLVAAEVEVDVIDRVLGDQDLGGAGHDLRIDAVQLDRANLLPRVELQHRQRLGVTLHQAAGGDHLADEQASNWSTKLELFPAELPVRGVGDARHRCEHHQRALVDQHPTRRVAR
jgi:hypothetical protein